MTWDKNLQVFNQVFMRSSVKCQLSDYVFLRCVPRRTIIAKTSNLHQKVGYRQDYKHTCKKYCHLIGHRQVSIPIKKPCIFIKKLVA